MTRSIARCFCLWSVPAGVFLLAATECPAQSPKPRVYVNRLTKIDDPQPLLNDQPDFVRPVQDVDRYAAPALINEKGPT